MGHSAMPMYTLSRTPTLNRAWNRGDRQDTWLTPAPPHYDLHMMLLLAGAWRRAGRGASPPARLWRSDSPSSGLHGLETWNWKQGGSSSHTHRTGGQHTHTHRPATHIFGALLAHLRPGAAPTYLSPHLLTLHHTHPFARWRTAAAHSHCTFLFAWRITYTPPCMLASPCHGTASLPRAPCLLTSTASACPAECLSTYVSCFLLCLRMKVTIYTAYLPPGPSPLYPQP